MGGSQGVWVGKRGRLYVQQPLALASGKGGQQVTAELIAGVGVSM